jgi:peptidoglycan/LPS O-acetylase OafA/YrhL
VPRTVMAVLAFTLIFRIWASAAQHRLPFGLLQSVASAPGRPVEDPAGCPQAAWVHSVTNAMPGRLFEFVLGMTAAVLLAGMRPLAPPKGGPWRSQARCPHRVRIRLWLAAATALGLLGLCVTHQWSPYSPGADVIWGLAFFCLVMYGGGCSAAGGGWLEWRPLTALGLISYSVYLIHEPLMRFTYALLRPHLHSPLRTLLFFELGMIPALIGLGWLFYCLVEARVIAAGKQRASPGAPMGGRAPRADEAILLE